MTTLVTGAAGFVGSEVAKSLAVAGERVIALDGMLENLYSNAEKIFRRKQLEKQFPEIEWLTVDLRRLDELDAIPATQITRVIHLAAMPGQRLSWREPELYYSCNAGATANLSKLFAERGDNLQSFVNVSTSSVYGKIATGDEASDLLPISPYGSSKLAAEHSVIQFLEDRVPISILRLFSVYGPGQRPDMAYRRVIDSILLDKTFSLYGNGLQARTNTFVEDAANAIVTASKGRFDGTFNIGGEEYVTLNEAIQIIEELMGKTLKRELLKAARGDQLETRASIRRAQDELGFRNNQNLRDGLAKQINWQKNFLGL